MTRAPLWQIVLALLVAAAGAAMVGTAWDRYASADRLLSEGAPASGQVVQVLAEQRETRDPADPAAQGRAMKAIAEGPLPVYAYPVEVPVVRFTAGDGRVHEIRGADAAPGTVRVGSAAAVRYRPEAPQQARPEAELADPPSPYALGILGVACLLGGLFVARGLARTRA